MHVNQALRMLKLSRRPILGLSRDARIAFQTCRGQIPTPHRQATLAGNDSENPFLISTHSLPTKEIPDIHPLPPIPGGGGGGSYGVVRTTNTSSESLTHAELRENKFRLPKQSTWS